MLRTITVRLYSNVAAGSDPFGDPVSTETYEDISGVLVYPVGADAIISDLQLYGKRTAYEICIPKGDAHNWEDKVVGFFGKRFRVFTPEIEYIDANVPLKWNKKVKVERIE